MGGSSSINGLLWIRGQSNDYDNWKQQGNKGWGWDDVLPYFVKSENNELGKSKYIVIQVQSWLLTRRLN